jgi:HD-like signal output (HDOD) protein
MYAKLLSKTRALMNAATRLHVKALLASVEAKEAEAEQASRQAEQLQYFADSAQMSADIAHRKAKEVSKHAELYADGALHEIERLGF